MSRRNWLLLSLLLVALGAPPDLIGQEAKKGRKVALLVAVQDYSDSGLSNLKYCENDITEMANVLKTQGYLEEDIIILTDTVAARKGKLKYVPTADHIRKELKGLVEDMRSEDTFLVAFSGHGVHLKALKDKGLFFCAKGSNLEKPETMVSLNEVYEQLEKNCRAELKLMFMDACRNDPSDGKAATDGKLESVTRPLIPDPPGGIVAFFSCSTGQKSYESDTLKHGIFFYHVIQGLKGGPKDDPISRKGEVTVPLLEDYLTQVVPVAVKRDKDDRSLRQVPERVGKLRGSVVLAMVAAVAPPTKEPKGGDEKEILLGGGVKMKLCWVPAGEAQLGSPKEEQDYLVKTYFKDERPTWLDGENETVRGKYSCKGFWMAKYPVTQEEWKAVMGNAPSNFKGDRLPVEQVCWFDAVEFCNKVSEKLGVPLRYDLSEIKRNADGTIETATVKVNEGSKGIRLPHEDEWEYACRGGKGNKQAFYFGDILNGDKANCNGNYPYGTTTTGDYLKTTTDVGKYELKAPHPWGLCDMHGNVYNWCENLYINTASFRVVRGGTWLSGGGFCRSAYRRRYEPSKRFNDLGFRLVLVPAGQ